ncbi:MAG: CPBP family intramembrane metalloprotease [Chloroflexi bacterium]|nr:CPBP family intramembrane metalloprotease [Chloroflexota bacterium]
MKKRRIGRISGIDLGTWAVLTEGSALASIAVVPYSLSVSGNSLKQINEQLAKRGRKPLTPAQFLALAFVQGHTTFGAASALGMLLGERMGIGPVHIKSLLEGKGFNMSAREAAAYAAGGAAASLVLAALDFTLFRSVREEFDKRGFREPEVWKSMLACLYGGFSEEVLLRLGLQTLLAGGIRALMKERTVPPTGAVMWPAIVLSNIAFGAGHLPATTAVVPLTPIVVARALVLNSVVGVPCGYLYWKKGLEAAMIAHGTADVVLHVGGSLLQRKKQMSTVRGVS